MPDSHDARQLKEPASPADAAIGLLKGVASLLGKLGEIADQGGRLHRAGTFRSASGAPGRVDVSVRVRTLEETGLAQDCRAVEEAGAEALADVVDVVADVMDEGAFYRVVAEMPGAGDDQAAFELAGRRLRIRAGSGPRRFTAEVDLPGPVAESGIRLTCRNGVVEVVCPKEEGTHSAGSTGGEAP